MYTLQTGQYILLHVPGHGLFPEKYKGCQDAYVKHIQLLKYSSMYLMIELNNMLTSPIFYLNHRERFCHVIKALKCSTLASFPHVHLWG